MSKNLYLVRHGQTAEKATDQDDFDRQLTSKGLQDSSRIGRHLYNKKVKPDIIVSSPALRARTTAELIAEQIHYDTTKIHLNEDIYEASIRILLQVVNQLKNEWDTIILVGHNPSITYLAEYITGAEIGDVASGGIVQIKFGGSKWKEISVGSCDFRSYEYPEIINV